jgi:hypothetical protein
LAKDLAKRSSRLGSHQRPCPCTRASPVRLATARGWWEPRRFAAACLIARPPTARSRGRAGSVAGQAAEAPSIQPSRTPPWESRCAVRPPASLLPPVGPTVLATSNRRCPKSRDQLPESLLILTATCPVTFQGHEGLGPSVQIKLLTTGCIRSTLGLGAPSRDLLLQVARGKRPKTLVANVHEPVPSGLR